MIFAYAGKFDFVWQQMYGNVFTMVKKSVYFTNVIKAQSGDFRSKYTVYLKFVFNFFHSTFNKRSFLFWTVFRMYISSCISANET